MNGKLSRQLKKQLNDVELGDLVCVTWYDASTGKSLDCSRAGVNVDIPVKTWGVFVAVLGRKHKYIVVCQNQFEYADGLYDLDYTAVPITWAVDVVVLQKAHVGPSEAERLFTSFVRGDKRVSRHKQRRLTNHGHH